MPDEAAKWLVRYGKRPSPYGAAGHVRRLLAKIRNLEAGMDYPEVEVGVARRGKVIACVHCARSMFLTDEGESILADKDVLQERNRKLENVAEAAKPLRHPKFTTFKGELIYYMNEAEKAKLVQTLADLEDGE